MAKKKQVGELSADRTKRKVGEGQWEAVGGDAKVQRISQEEQDKTKKDFKVTLEFTLNGKKVSRDYNGKAHTFGKMEAQAKDTADEMKKLAQEKGANLKIERIKVAAAKSDMKKSEEKKPLNKPMRDSDGGKKFKVYVKDPKSGNVKTVRFGDPNMEIKRDDADRRSNFRARHNCSDKKDKTKAGYWSCKMWAKKPVSRITKSLIEELEKAKNRCWEGYEPVPGKEPYSDDSCRPKKKKKVKKSEVKELEKAIVENPLSGVDINTAEHSMDAMAADPKWLQKIKEHYANMEFGETPREMFLCYPYQLTASQVDDGLYSGYVKNIDKSSADYGMTMCHLKKMTAPQLVQALSAKEYIGAEAEVDMPKPPEMEKEIEHEEEYNAPKYMAEEVDKRMFENATIHGNVYMVIKKSKINDLEQVLSSKESQDVDNKHK